MIVTANPHGDFNATSQILRYSALAREVTVPRIPSITESILQVNPTHARSSDQSACGNFDQGQPCFTPNSKQQHQRQAFPSQRTLTLNLRQSFTSSSPTISEDRIMTENAILEIARLTEEIQYLRGSLAREHEDRVAAEAHFLSLEEKMIELEQAIREDCVAEFEQRLAVELSRWKAGMQMAIERGEEHWDRKMELFERGLRLHEDAAEMSDYGGLDNKENVLIENLEDENARLRREITILKRELSGRSPSRRVPLIERDDITTSIGDAISGGSKYVGQNENVRPENLQRRMESLSLREGQEDWRKVASINSTRAKTRSRGDDAASPSKRIRSRKLTARRWEGGLDDGDDVF